MDGTNTLAIWREAGEWWRGEPYREVTRYLDDKGIRRESQKLGPSVGQLNDTGQKELDESRKEEWSLRERKIRDEKVAAACGKLPKAYYERAAAERNADLRLQSLETTWNVFVRDNETKQTQIVNCQSSIGNSYAPLHCLSGYSFGRSTMLAVEIASHASHYGCPATAITDIHSLVGCVEFSKACKRNGVKPLIGASIEMPEGGALVLIAQNKTGYRNLSRLITECHLHEPRRHPMGSWQRLQTHNEGLICLTGGDTGPLDRLLVKSDTREAWQMVQKLHEIFGPRLFLEVERSYLPWQKRVNSNLLQISEELGIKAVAGGSVTHGKRFDFPAQDVLVCADTLCLIEEVMGRKELRDPTQLQVGSFPQRALNAERFFHSPGAMFQLYQDRPDLLENTLLVADMCDEDVLPSRVSLPKMFEDDSHALKEIVEANAHFAYPNPSKATTKRIQFELSRILRLGFATHFLVAYDTCRWAREQGIQMSGRGSVIDSCVAYILGFSRIDALRHNLHFDRFLPEDGSKRPDIDIDFEAHRRDDVRGYMIGKYGVERTATVAAIGCYNTRGIVREIGKVFGLPNETIGFLAKRIHGGVPPDQLEAALEKRPELRDSNIPRERFQWVFKLAERLMDVPRNIRCHSSGVVISDTPIRDIVPVMWSGSGAAEESRVEDQHLRIIQWDKGSSKHYFDKFDVLCLRGQDVMSGIEKRIRIVNPDFSAEQVPVDDPETYRAMRSGELIGIPQSASPAMRQAHIRLQTQHLTDASLVQAGIRPGVGGAVKLNQLIRRRRGLEDYTFEHPDLEHILGHTYGIIVFQEQVDMLLQTFCGCSSGEAEDIRDAIYKRRKEDYADFVRDKLIERMLARSYPISIAEHVFELVSQFKGYGFAQGHALAFAELSVRCIHLMQHHPAEYFSSLLSAQPAGYYGPCTLVNEARSRGVQIVGADVLRSEKEFSVEPAYSTNPMMMIPNGAIRVGLMQVKGLSKETCARIITKQTQIRQLALEPEPQPLHSVQRQRSKIAVMERPKDYGEPKPEPAFTSFFHFVREIKPEVDELEALILCGALDSLCPNRRAMLWAIPSAYDYARTCWHEGDNPRLPFDIPEPKMNIDVEDFSEEEKAVHERTVLELDVDRHLMYYEADRIRARGCITSEQIKTLSDGDWALVVGNPIRLRFPPTPSGKRVVFFDLEDEVGLLNVTCFDRVYRRDGRAIVTSPYVTIRGQVQDRDGHKAFLAQKVWPYKPRLMSGQSVKLPVTTADFLVG
jgi:error-prone DNA polymerase